jgi:hypothetical protein
MRRVFALVDRDDPGISIVTVGEECPRGHPEILCRVPTTLADEIGAEMARQRGLKFVPLR